MKKNNKGFTLVELIVVICIIGIFAALIASSISPSSLAKARHCAIKTYDLIAKCRIGCLSRSGDVYLKIYVDGDGNIWGDYYEGESTPVSSDVLSDNSVSVCYRTGTDEINLSSGPLTLSFNRSTGSLKPLSGESYCESIKIFCGSKGYTIDLVPSTGALFLR